MPAHELTPDEFAPYRHLRLDFSECHRCDDCERLVPLTLLSPWVETWEGEGEVKLCERCHANRPPSAWGPWAADDEDPEYETTPQRRRR